MAVIAHDVRIVTTPVIIRPARPAPPVPRALSPAGRGNLKLWLYHPADLRGLPTGVFVQKAAAPDWQFTAANPDGSLSLQLAPGQYLLDTVEPPGSPLRRHRYQISVSAGGAASIGGMQPDGQGVYAVTLDAGTVPGERGAKLLALASEPASTFKPASACQLMDQVTPVRSFNTDTSWAFPRCACVCHRLAASGR